VGEAPRFIALASRYLSARPQGFGGDERSHAKAVARAEARSSGTARLALQDPEFDRAPERMPASHVTRRRCRGSERDSPAISGVESDSVHTQSMSGPRPCLIHGRGRSGPGSRADRPGGRCDPGWSTSAAPPQCATSGRLRSGAGTPATDDGQEFTRAREGASASPRVSGRHPVRVSNARVSSAAGVRRADLGMVARKAGAPRRVRAAAGPIDDR